MTHLYFIIIHLYFFSFMYPGGDYIHCRSFIINLCHRYDAVPRLYRRLICCRCAFRRWDLPRRAHAQGLRSTVQAARRRQGVGRQQRIEHYDTHTACILREPTEGGVRGATELRASHKHQRAAGTLLQPTSDSRGSSSHGIFLKKSA